MQGAWLCAGIVFVQVFYVSGYSNIRVFQSASLNRCVSSLNDSIEERGNCKVPVYIFGGFVALRLIMWVIVICANALF